MRGFAFAIGLVIAMTTVPCHAQTGRTWVEHWHNHQGQLMQRTCRIEVGQRRCGKATRVASPKPEPPPSN